MEAPCIPQPDDWSDDAGNVLPDTTVVEANKTYLWRYTPEDTNYAPLTGSVVLYPVSNRGDSSDVPDTPSYPIRRPLRYRIPVTTVRMTTMMTATIPLLVPTAVTVLLQGRHLQIRQPWTTPSNVVIPLERSQENTDAPLPSS